MSLHIKGYSVRTSSLPDDVRTEAISVINDLINNQKEPEHLGGKRFTDFSYLASIPLRRSYRLVLRRRSDKEWAPLAVHSHERYNKEDYTKKNIRLLKRTKKQRANRQLNGRAKAPRSQRVNEWQLNGKPLWINSKMVPASTFAQRYGVPYQAIYDALNKNKVLGEKQGNRWMLCKSEELIEWLKSYNPTKNDPPSLEPPAGQKAEGAKDEKEPLERSLLEEANRLWLKAARLQAEADNLRYEAQRLRRLYEQGDKEVR